MHVENRSQLYDLHCHSTCSDGTLDPWLLVQRAADHGVQVLSITDHDTVDAYKLLNQKIQQLAAPLPLQLIAGIEFSATYNKRCVHILGLDIDPSHPVMQTAVAIQTEHRQVRTLKIAAKFDKLNIPNSLEGAKSFAQSASIGRPHFAQFLVENGYCKNQGDAFKRYLGDNKPGFVQQQWPDLEVINDWILQAGGIPVIAHPSKYGMTRSKLCKFVETFKNTGGLGIEVLCGPQTPQVTKTLTDIALQYNLAGSIGSDFHSPDQRWLHLGMHKTIPNKCPPIWQHFKNFRMQ